MKVLMSLRVKEYGKGFLAAFTDWQLGRPLGWGLTPTQAVKELEKASGIQILEPKEAEEDTWQNP